MIVCRVFSRRIHESGISPRADTSRYATVTCFLGELAEQAGQEMGAGDRRRI